ncbi:hypothetical protein Tco_0701518 [Tanacetum coccineum]
MLKRCGMLSNHLFGGNDESKKMQKYILKQQFEGFSVSNSEGLHKGYNRFQSRLSQLKIHGACVSTEDANHKFLRVFESDVKGSTGSFSSAHNVAFVSSKSTSSTNDVSTAYGVSTSSGYNSQRENSSSYTDESLLSSLLFQILLMPRNQLALTRTRLSASIAITQGTLLESADQKEIKKAEEEMQGTMDIKQKTIGGDLENKRNLKLWETVKEQNTYSLSPKADKRDWNGLMSKRLGLGYGFTKKACFVCGSFNHLIRDYDFYEKRMAKQVELNKKKGKGTGQGENRPVWNNVQRLNHQNKFVPKAVLSKTGIFPVNTARQNLFSQAATTSTARKVNTAKPIVSEIKPKNNFYKSHSPIRRPFNRTTTPKANFSNQKVNTAEVKAVSAVGGIRETAVSPQQVVIEDPKDITGTKSPNTIVDQFLNTASSQTVNDEKQIHATVDSKAVESSSSHDTTQDSRDSLEGTRSEGDQGRKNAKPRPTLDDSTFDDLDADHGMDYMDTEEPVNEGRPKVSTATPMTPPTTTSVFKDEYIFLADALPLSSIDPKDKGKGVLKESPVKKVKKSDLDAAQVTKDAKVARLVYEKELAELEKEKEERQRQQQASVDYIANLYDEVQAKMDASEELAARLQMEEIEMYTVEERSRLLDEYFENRKKQLAIERSAAIRNKPPTRTQLRSLMMTYLKHTESSVRSDLLFNDEDGEHFFPHFCYILAAPKQAPEGEGSAIHLEPQPTPSTSQPNVSEPQITPLHIETSPTVAPQTEAHQTATRSERVLEQPNEPPLSEGHTSRSREGRMEQTFEIDGELVPILHHYDHLSLEGLDLEKRKEMLKRGDPQPKEKSQEIGKKKEVKHLTPKKEEIQTNKDFEELDDHMENIEEETVDVATTRVSTASAPVSTAGVTIKTAEPRTPPTATTVFDDEDVTMKFRVVMKRKEVALDDFQPMDTEAIKDSEKKVDNSSNPARGCRKKTLDKKRTGEKKSEESAKKQKLEDVTEEQESA